MRDSLLVVVVAIIIATSIYLQTHPLESKNGTAVALIEEILNKLHPDEFIGDGITPRLGSEQ